MTTISVIFLGLVHYHFFSFLSQTKNPNRNNNNKLYNKLELSRNDYKSGGGVKKVLLPNNQNNKHDDDGVKKVILNNQNDNNNDNDDDDINSIPSRSQEICSLLASSTNTPMEELWDLHTAAILAASQHPDDPEYSHESWTYVLLSELVPKLLKKSLILNKNDDDDGGGGGFNPKAMERVLHILGNRINDDKDEHPPLKIAVLGDALSEGIGCDLATVVIPKGSIMGNPTYCAWPYRLEAFIHNILHTFLPSSSPLKNSKTKKLIQIVNMSEEGTSTKVKNPLIKYWMYPPLLLPYGPDVIIHDYHDVNNQQDLEDFLHATKLSRPCGDPPLILSMARSLPKTSGDGIMRVDYSDIISKVTKLDNSAVANSGHKFGMAGHVAIAWTLGYAIGNSVLHHCEQQLLQQQHHRVHSDSSCQQSPCIAAWLSSPNAGKVKNPSDISDTLSPFIVENKGWNPQSDMMAGWSRKSGLVATDTGAKIVLEYANIPLTVQVFTIMTLKSDAAKYMNGVAKFTIRILSGGDQKKKKKRKKMKEKYDISFEIKGGREKGDSSGNSDNSAPPHITYPFEFNVGENNKAEVGDTVRMEIELIEGQSFKILGMMFCSR
eukprot:CAMPEP_0195512904 /NCGR_PEP_ID=MMETSP0794_2-20130614/4697_1 /TAXON_ID=515487 /ORGANISM="Stephanopyxis turris, Strain CCMP 815" /LENGTH=604 /DNA_ID=CAMNT_0040640789 /DNA_START=316 /DNA_END=2130 /DNA_ORIENTATION=+